MALSSVPDHQVATYYDVARLPKLSHLAPKGSTLREELLRALGSTIHYGIIPPYLDDPMAWDELGSILRDGYVMQCYDFDPVTDDCRVIDMTKLSVVESLVPGMTASDIVSAISRAYYGVYETENRVLAKTVCAVISLFKQKAPSIRETPGGWSLMITA